MYKVFMISSSLVLLVYFLFGILFLKSSLYMEEISPYECGFDPGSNTRFTFSYRFFLIAILFIIFDVEISLLLPIPFLLGSEVGMWIFFMFMYILIVGLLYEYFWGSLDWMETVIRY